jgi:hypothetical protein
VCQFSLRLPGRGCETANTRAAPKPREIEDGLWERIEPLQPAELRGAGLLEFSRAAVDGSHLRAMKGGDKTGSSPVEPRRAATSAPGEALRRPRL